LRLWAGFLARGLQRHAAGAGHRPLLVVLDCKGGADSRRVADRARRVLRDAGARSTAIWPDEASLSLWELPPRQLTTTLVDMIEHGTADGGIWLLRTPHPEPAAGLAGSQPAADTSRRVLGVALWGREGSSRVRGTPVADPAIIRSLDVGQAAYIYRGGVTYVQVKRLVAAPAALEREPMVAGPPSAGAVAAARAGAPPPGTEPPATELPDAGALLNEAFGPETG